MKRFLASALLALLSGLLVLTPAPPPARGQELGLLRIGLVQTLFHDTPEAVVQIAMRPFQSFLESQTGLSGQVVCAGDAYSVGKKLKDDQVQLAVLHGIEFAWIRQRYPSLKPLIIAVNRHASLRAVLVVKQNGKVKTVEDLQGKVATLARQSKEHCRLFFERQCVKAGMKPTDFFKRVRDPSTYEKALQEVFEGKADAVVVDRTALEDYASERPARASGLRVLKESEPFPCGVLAYDSEKLPEGTVKRLREALLSAKDTSTGKRMLEQIRLSGFEAVPADFDAQLTAIARAYPPTVK